MGVLIKNMEMPKNCAACIMKVGSCKERIYMESRPDACPITEPQSVEDFEASLHKMFDHIWDCEIDHSIFQDTVGDLMAAVIQLYRREIS